MQKLKRFDATSQVYTTRQRQGSGKNTLRLTVLLLPFINCVFILLKQRDWIRFNQQPTVSYQTDNSARFKAAEFVYVHHLLQDWSQKALAIRISHLKRRIFVTLELTFYIYRGSESSSTKSDTLPCSYSSPDRTNQNTDSMQATVSEGEATVNLKFKLKLSTCVRLCTWKFTRPKHFLFLVALLVLYCRINKPLITK